MSFYAVGHLKRNTESGEVAVRTIFPIGKTPEEAMMEWLCAAPNAGPRNAKTQDVEGPDWVDVYIPEPILMPENLAQSGPLNIAPQ